jgi:cell wall-associated NlpC family hydrolase
MTDLQTLAQSLLGREHTPEFNCWDLVLLLFQEGQGITLHTDIERNRALVHEVWWQDDPHDLCTCVQPYDLLVMHTRGPLADHIGVVLDGQTFIHNREKVGVCIEKLQMWLPRCLQLLRVQPRG